MVTNFSNRKLTYSSDVLPALSGLASAMTAVHHCTYLAGLWSEDLQVGLVWFVADAQSGRHGGSTISLHTEEDKPQRPWTPNLPSWSWISRYGSMASFRGWENNHRLIKHEGISLTPAPRACQVYKTNAFGHITTRSLNLKGRVKTAIIIDRKDE